jgi:hypothetical protein
MKKASKNKKKEKSSKQEKVVQSLEAFLGEPPYQPKNFAFQVYSVEHEHPEDSLGTIRFLDDGLPPQEKLKLLKEQLADDPSYPIEFIIDLRERFSSAKNKSALRLDEFDLKTLEKGLGYALKYFSIRAEHRGLKAKLAWANTAFKNKKNSYDKNLREAGFRLGFTKGRKSTNPSDLLFPKSTKGKKITFDSFEVIQKYLELVSSNSDKRSAIIELCKIFPFANHDACSRYLRKQGLKKVPSFGH